MRLDDRPLPVSTGEVTRASFVRAGSVRLSVAYAAGSDRTSLVLALVRAGPATRDLPAAYGPAGARGRAPAMGAGARRAIRRDANAGINPAPARELADLAEAA